MTTRIPCQFAGCDYTAENASEAVAIAMFTSHTASHQQTSTPAPTTKQRMPKIDRPELKQDTTDEDWLTFEAEWKRFKRCTHITPDEVADNFTSVVNVHSAVYS